MPKIKVTQVKSVIGYAQPQKDTIRALGLGRPNNSVITEDTPHVRGMINKVKHLVVSEPVEA